MGIRYVKAPDFLDVRHSEVVGETLAVNSINQLISEWGFTLLSVKWEHIYNILYVCELICEAESYFSLS